MENKPALLSKDTFCTALRMVKEQEAINEEVATALCKVSDGLGTFGCDNKWFDALMMVLKVFMVSLLNLFMTCWQREIRSI